MSMGYAAAELRRRAGRTITTAAGLAAGVALVMVIVGVSDGLAQTQETVLSPLASVGTDILITREVSTEAAASTTTPGGSAAPSPRASGGAGAQGGQQGGAQQGPGNGGGFFAGGPNSPLSQLNQDDADAVLQDNSSVLTDLSALGPAGTEFSHDFFVTGTLLTFPDAAIQQIKGVSGVTSAVGGLTLSAQHVSGTVPKITDTYQTGGQTITATSRPAPMTAAERAAVAKCLEKQGVSFGPPAGGGTGGGGTGGGNAGGGGRANPDFLKCLPTRFQEYQTNVVVPRETITRVLQPPQTDTTTDSYTVAGVDPSSSTTGLITEAQLQSGDWFSTDAATSATQVIVSATYATKQDVVAGGTLTINDEKYAVVGVVNPTLTGNTADVYFTLPTVQKLASKDQRVNEVLVTASSAADVDAVAASISAALPGAHVVTAKSVADSVTGSLSQARTLVDHLGAALAVIVLVAAFLIAILLTIASISKRVREIGTLRAVGWTRRRVVGQITLENLGIGLLGAIAGVALGFALAAVVEHVAPSLTATTAGVGIGTPIGGLTGGAVAITRSVPMSVPITTSTIVIGVAVALAGALLAGAVGGWRAARLSPTEALRDLG
jgi:putative ABC transport system permease protein